jgi:hypothetical protein
VWPLLGVNAAVATFAECIFQTGTTAMRKLIIGATIALPLALVIVPASALPGAGIGHSSTPDLIEVKGGRGHGHGHGFGRGRGYNPPGWSRGRKVGWRGRGCPPGHWKKGWC